jgi:hypothetical protein
MTATMTIPEALALRDAELRKCLKVELEDFFFPSDIKRIADRVFSLRSSWAETVQVAAQAPELPSGFPPGPIALVTFEREDGKTSARYDSQKRMFIDDVPQWFSRPSERQMGEAEERAAFEEWMGDTNPGIGCEGAPDYYHSTTVDFWFAWQARAALTAPPAVAQQVPVARVLHWCGSYERAISQTIVRSYEEYSTESAKISGCWAEGEKLYTPPRPAPVAVAPQVPLTERQIDHIRNGRLWPLEWTMKFSDGEWFDLLEEVTRAVERAHGIAASPQPTKGE